MGLRDILQGRPALSIGFAVIVLIVAAVMTMRSGGPPPDQRWFYDVEAHTLFARADATLPPIQAPSGADGVRAYVFSCGACTEADRFIGYLQTYDKPQVNPDAPSFEDVPVREEWVAAASQEGAPLEWIPAESAAGMRLTNNFRGRCPHSLTACRPDAVE